MGCTTGHRAGRCRSSERRRSGLVLAQDLQIVLRLRQARGALVGGAQIALHSLDDVIEGLDAVDHLFGERGIRAQDATLAHAIANGADSYAPAARDPSCERAVIVVHTRW